MSALDSIGEAQHRLLNADTEIGTLQVTSAVPSVTDTLIRARQEIAEVRAILGAVQLILRGRILAEMLDHHELVATELREHAVWSRVPIHARRAEMYAGRARALRALIGPVDAPNTAGTEGGTDGR